MKKLFVTILMILIFAVSAFAADQSKPLTFQWEQVGDLQYVTGWSLYWSNVSGSGYVKVVDIPYTPGSGPTFVSDQTLTVTGVPGSMVKKYFVLTARGNGALESGYSNEVGEDFAIPLAHPFNLIIKVKVGG